MSRRFSIVMTAVAFAAVPSLVGCSVGTSDGPAEKAPSASATTATSRPASTARSTPDAPPISSATPSDSDTESGDTGVSSGSVETRFTRDDLIRLAAQRLNCVGGSVTVDAVGAVIQVAEDCQSVTVSSAGSSVVTEAVGTLSVTSVGAIIYVTDVDTVTFAEGADANMVVFQGKAPHVSDAATGNLVVNESQLKIVE